MHDPDEEKKTKRRKCHRGCSLEHGKEKMKSKRQSLQNRIVGNGYRV